MNDREKAAGRFLKSSPFEKGGWRGICRRTKSLPTSLFQREEFFFTGHEWRRLAIFLISVSLFSATHAAPRAASKAEQRKLVAVQSVEAVQLANPILFWREGKEISKGDVWLLKIRVANPVAFLPRDREGPTFMVGHSAAIVLQDAVETGGVAVLLAPTPAPGEPAVAWVAPDVSVRSLSRKTIQRFLEAPAVKARALALRAPSSAIAPARYKDLGELLRDVRKEIKKAK